MAAGVASGVLPCVFTRGDRVGRPYPTSILRNMRIFREGTGRLVSGRGFCYHLFTYGLRLAKPFLLLPVDNLRRVSPLVSDLLSTIDQEDAPVAESRVCLCAHRPSALLKNERS